MSVSVVEVFIIFIITVILVMYIQHHYGEVEYVKSSIDGKEYLVRNLSDKQKAANYLADINKDLKTLVQHMMAKYPVNEYAQQLYKNYNPDAVSEGSIESGYTSYSINKGEKIILCIRQRDKSFVDKNTILYVAIHELAHLMTPEIGHTTLFWKNFKWILEEAVSIKLYTHVDYTEKPSDYCGITITSSVL